ncbi:MAG: DNA-processing protein DprA [Myxococcota bacterium]
MNEAETSDCDRLQSYHVLACLAALGVTGRYWPCLEAHGGPEQLARQGVEAVLGVLVQTGKARRDERQMAQLLQEALQQARQLDNFVARGGWIMGACGSRELMRLNRSRTPLLCAFFEGERQLLQQRPVVAIVGSRRACARGLQRTQRLAGCLGREGVLVVSGAAVGTDCAAHEAAVQAGGRTLAILGEPLQPARSLLPDRLSHLPSDAICALTPYGPWVTPASFLFAARNQYMAAMADAVVIMQGTAGSGTLHTAKYARQLGVALWAMPGDIEDPLAAASNQLLQQGWAKAYIDPDSLLSELIGTKKKSSISVWTAMSAKKPLQLANMGLSDMQQQLLGMLHGGPGVVTVDELCQKLHIQVQQLQGLLLELELRSLIVRDGAQVRLGEV